MQKKIFTLRILLVVVILFRPVLATNNNLLDVLLDLICRFIPFIPICNYCTSSIGCNNNEYCERGSCGTTRGVCEVRPESCIEIFNPVCGCDGITYTNDCQRKIARVTKDYDGECLCQSNNDCSTNNSNNNNRFCDKSDCSDNTNGVCTERPSNCAEIYQPVCGCNGITYGNDCYRQMAGISKANDGTCDDSIIVCGGITGQTCSNDEFCDLPVGTCNFADIQGECVTVGDDCINLFDPVCGCDGNTYSNDCFRIQAQVSKRSDGECPTTIICGGIAGQACPNNNEFCDLPVGTCNGADLQGECVTVGDDCINLFDPVCGCDRKTYSNDCFRIQARVSKDSDGECSTTVCGGIAGQVCTNSNEFCDLPAGNCNFADIQGECVTVGDDCINLFDPVCGCDGKTYSNDCFRIQARVSKDSDGECPTVCGGIAGQVCTNSNAFCDLPVGTCNFADLQGECVTVGDDCINLFDPVCGCDGKTYSNDCFRIQARVSKDSDGECPSI